MHIRKQHLSGELVIESMEVGQVRWYQSQAGLPLGWVIKASRKTLQVSQQRCLEPTDVTPGHWRRRGAIFSLRAERASREISCLL